MRFSAATAPAPFDRAVHDRAIELDLPVRVRQPAVADAVVVRVGFDDRDGLDDGVEPRPWPSPVLSISMPVSSAARPLALEIISGRTPGVSAARAFAR